MQFEVNKCSYVTNKKYRINSDTSLFPPYSSATCFVTLQKEFPPHPAMHTDFRVLERSK